MPMIGGLGNWMDGRVSSLGHILRRTHEGERCQAIYWGERNLRGWVWMDQRKEEERWKIVYP